MEHYKESNLIELLTLKLLSDQFEKERVEIRNDFLVRGICVKEVDELIEEPSYYKMAYIPNTARWNTLIMEKGQLSHRFHQAFQTLVPSYIEWDMDDFSLAKIINILDFYPWTDKTQMEKESEIQQLEYWIKEKDISIQELPIFHYYSKFLL
nr:type I restriction-modification system subunit M N-terminal domain-containing protein [Bacillus sp. FJAT-49736]